MYIQGDPANEFHVKTYGHPSKVGFKDVDAMWKVDEWRPEYLLDLYVKAGAKYFMALANHHDNFDCFRSRYHGWNSTRIGPERDIVGTWRGLVRERGLRFGVSNHSAHAWHWLQTAYGYDPVGPMAGVRYDAYQLMKNGVAASKRTAWAGLDPQELYVGPTYVLPDGITTEADALKWHNEHDRKWSEDPPEKYPEFTNTWFMRCRDLLDTYDPDMIYFDDDELPLGQTGVDVTTHFYNSSLARRGKLDVVVTGKNIKPEHKGAIVLDLERGRADRILDEPWQVDTCLGDWHYRRSIFEEHKYKTPKTVVHMLLDAVSKNGNLCLNVPLRGNGTIDSDELAIVEGIGEWMKVYGEGIHGSRPYTVFGEGPPETVVTGGFNESKGRPYGAEDVRFVTKGGRLYAYGLGWPDDGLLRVKTLGAKGSMKVARVEMVGDDVPLKFEQAEDALVVHVPEAKRNEIAVGVRIAGDGGAVVAGA
jgi:alpha-L-fucosidase